MSTNERRQRGHTLGILQLPITFLARLLLPTFLVAASGPCHSNVTATHGTTAQGEQTGVLQVPRTLSKTLLSPMFLF